MKALLIIDMQQGSFTPASPRYDTNGVVDRINILCEYFRAAGDKVIFIQHDGSKQNDFIPGSAEWHLLPTLRQVISDIAVNKTANDCFYCSALQQTLSDHHISELVVTGCATDFCVDTTIKSALSKDYSITVIADAHTTADRPYANAASVINHHNWVWKNMLPTKGRLQVMTLTEYLTQ